MSVPETQTVEELTVRIGLLMEAIEAQRSQAAAAVGALQAHAAGLDAVVRDEIRATLEQELRALTEEGQRAAHSLRHAARAAQLSRGAWSAAIATVSAALPLALAGWLLPSRGEVAALTASREELTERVRQLAQAGGRAQLRRCGTAQRLCVRIDRSAPPYGEAADYFVIQGY